MRAFGRMALLACAAAAFVAVPAVTLQAAETVAALAPAGPAVVIPEPSVWQNIWIQIQPALTGIVTAVLAALGVLITTQVKGFLGERASQAVNSVYQMMADQAAGWLIAQLHSVGAATTMPNGAKVVAHPDAVRSLNAAVDYAKKSYPDVIKKLEVPDHDLSKDILAAAGKLIAGGGSPIGIAGAVGSLMSSLTR